jgi:phosphomannomutase
VSLLGICPTPTVQLAVEQEGAAGGISVTASHNPIEWNGLKFIASTGMFLDAEANRELWGIAEGPRTYARWDGIGGITRDPAWLKRHIDLVCAIPFLDLGRVQKRGFTVVVDCVNAAGGAIVPQMLERLGCRVIRENCDVSGVFQHTPEPIPENLTMLARRVVEEGADLGIAVDPDVDRLVLITEEGKPYVEEYTIASAVKFVLERHRGRENRVVVNLSTTRAVDDIARTYGAEVIRTPVGEINVAKRMKEVGAIIGGEGSGGVILPAVHLGRDALVGIGLLLQMLAEFPGTLSQLKATLPRYSIVKGKIELGGTSPDAVLNRIAESQRGKGEVNVEDGVKLDFPDHWIHLRKSNTEPIVRIIAEAATAEEAARLVDQWKNEIKANL